MSKQAIQDALEVAFLFNIYDRLADAMDGTCRLWLAGLPGGRKKTAQTRVHLGSIGDSERHTGNV